MIQALRWLAAICAVGVVLAWFALGAHRGWTKTSVAIEKIDPVTEIVGYEMQSRFVPGVDFLVVGLGGSAGIFVLSLVLSKFLTKKNHP